MASANNNRLAARERHGLTKDDYIDLHHIDPTLKYRDRERYDLWLDEDLVEMDRGEHHKLHSAGENNGMYGKSNSKPWGHPMSEEGRKNIGAASKGRIPWNKDLTTEDERVYDQLKGVREYHATHDTSGANNPYYGHHEKRPNLIGKTGPRGLSWKLVDGKRVYYRKEEIA